MANHVSDQSKRAMCHYARSIIRQQIKILAEVGCSFSFIEKQLYLVQNGGATAHSIFHNKTHTVPTHDLLQQVHELLTKRTNDLFDEKGFPTQETNELVTRIEAILKQGGTDDE